MTVKIFLDQGKLMKTIVDAMVSVSEDVTIEISENGFRAQARDIGNAIVVDTFLDKQIFSKIDAPSSGIFHIDLEDFSDFIKTSKSDDSLKIEDNTDRGTLDLELKSSEITKRIQLRLNDVKNHRFMKIIDRKFLSGCEMDAGLFADAVKAAELGDEHVTLTHDKEKLHFTAASNTRSAEATIHYIDNNKVGNVNFETGTYQNRSGDTVQIPEVHEATFGLKFLKRISKIGRSGQTLKLSMTNSEPLRIIYTIDDEDNEEQGYVAFAVAPRVLEDDIM